MTLFRHDGHKATRVTVVTTYDDGREQVLELAGPDLMVDTLCVYENHHFGPRGNPVEVNVRVGSFDSYEARRPEDPSEPAGLQAGPGSEIPLDGRVEPEPCRKTADTPTVCTNCGHTGVMHPGSMNPALRACLLCQLENVRDDRG